MATFPDPELSASLRVSIETNGSAISKALSEEFKMLGFYPTSEEHIADVVDDVSYIESSIQDIFIIEAKDGVATAEISFEVSFEAEVTFEDSSTGMWDSEVKVMVGMEVCRKTVSRTWRGLVEFELIYDSQDFDDLTVESLSIPEAEIEVNIDESYCR